MQQISEKNIFNLEKEKMKENILKENHFEQKKLNSSNPQENSNNKENVMTSFPNPNMGKEKDDVKIVNLGVFGNSRKRPVGIISQNPLACEVTKAELEDIAHNDKKTKIT